MKDKDPEDKITPEEEDYNEFIEWTPEEEEEFLRIFGNQEGNDEPV